MNEKQVADRLRHIADGPTLTMEARRELHGVADELAPPQPTRDMMRYKQTRHGWMEPDNNGGWVLLSDALAAVEQAQQPVTDGAQDEGGAGMTDKEIAERLDTMLKHKVGSFKLGEEIMKLRDELAPPRPEPGTVLRWRIEPGTAVWWRMDGGEWQTGIISANEQIVDAEIDAYELGEVEWKPARILADDEVRVRVPPVSEWPDEAEELHCDSWFANRGKRFMRRSKGITITREEAERMEARDD